MLGFHGNPNARERGSLLFLAAILGVAACQPDGSASGQDTAATEIVENFDRHDYDHMRWTLNNLGVSLTKVSFSDGTLRINVPPAIEKRPLMGLESRFGVEGDFEIRVDYRIRAMPRPQTEWVNASIFIIGPDGMAAITRTNNSATGDGYSLWFQPPDGSKAKGAATNVKTSDRAGTLYLARSGAQLAFSSSARGQPPNTIGSVEYGEKPIDKVAFHLLVPPMKSPVDIEFDSIAIKANRFTRLAFTPPPQQSWLASILVATAVAAVFGAACYIWTQRSR